MCVSDLYVSALFSDNDNDVVGLFFLNIFYYFSYTQHGRTPLHVACAAIQPCVDSVHASLNPVSK